MYVFRQLQQSDSAAVWKVVMYKEMHINLALYLLE